MNTSSKCELLASRMLFDYLVQNASTNFSGHYSASQSYGALTSGVTQSESSNPEVQSQSSHSQSESPDNTILILRSCIASETAARDKSVAMSLDPPPPRSSDNTRKSLLPHRIRSTRTQAVFVVGPPGYFSVLLLSPQHLTTI